MRTLVNCSLAVVCCIPLCWLGTGQDLKAQESQDTRKKSKPSVAVVYSDQYLIQLGGLESAHPFDIKKYQKIHQALLDDGLLTKAQTFQPSEATLEQLSLVHSNNYLTKSLSDSKKVVRYLEAPPAMAYLPIDIDKAVLRPFRMATGGTIKASDVALKSGIAINIGGGYHHAKPNIGEGFCLYADIPVAIKRLQKQKKIKRAVVIDVDAHQGNGTIVCLKGDSSVFTFSMHEGGIYPIPKEKGDLDVELKAGISDEAYMKLLKQHLPDVLDRAKADICFVVGGCDTLDGDPLTHLKMTHQGIVKRDAFIVAECVKRKLPVVLTTSGGYSPGAWEAQYKSFANLLKSYGLFKAKVASGQSR